MNLVHWHLLLNHFPIVGTFITLGLLLFGILKKNQSIILTASYLMLVLALITIPAFYTGEPAEEAIERLPGISHALIHEHEEAAELSFLIMLITGSVALGYILLDKIQAPIAKRLPPVLLLFIIVTALFMARAGNEGGKIRHTELQTVENNPALPVESKSENHEEHEQH